MESILHDASFKARFWAKVKRGSVDSCWEWTAALDSPGYGKMSLWVNGKTIHLRASRAAWMLHNGRSLNADECICHSCDNRKCCNPAHLWVGSKSENSKDMATKGRMFQPENNGENNAAAKLTWTDVRFIRTSTARSACSCH